MPTPIVILTVAEVTRKIKQILEGGFPSVAIQGELSNVKRHSSGHLYFTLKDESSQISGVMWRSRVGALSFTPADGMKVVATGRVTVYEPQGKYQIDAISIRPLGVGELQIAFEKLKEKLGAEGLFAPERKRAIPRYPTRIGIVTSPTGAALHDLLTVLRRRFPALTVVLAPARVQGVGAAEEIAQGIADLNELGGVDVMIVGRGGGSIEDLWAFNEEVVARAIAASGIPVISAVGHEVDVTIADFVADLRAPTPTAAGELAVPDQQALRAGLSVLVRKLRRDCDGLVGEGRERIDRLLRSYGFNRPADRVRQASQQLDEAIRRLRTGGEHRLELQTQGANNLRLRLESLNPRLVLKRGYAIVSRGEELVTAAADVRSGEGLGIEFHDGKVRVRTERR
jgi:exodeoxyribonuclease VII large subunit